MPRIHETTISTPWPGPDIDGYGKAIAKAFRYERNAMNPKLAGAVGIRARVSGPYKELPTLALATYWVETGIRSAGITVPSYSPEYISIERIHADKDPRKGNAPLPKTIEIEFSSWAVRDA